MFAADFRPNTLSATRHCTNNEKRLLAGCNRCRQAGVGRFVGQILLARKKSNEGPAPQRPVITDTAAQHRICGFKRIQHGANRRRPLNFQLEFAVQSRQSSQVRGEDYPDHLSV